MTLRQKENTILKFIEVMYNLDIFESVNDVPQHIAEPLGLMSFPDLQAAVIRYLIDRQTPYCLIVLRYGVDRNRINYVARTPRMCGI
jgi:hypothetical protein